MPMYGTTSRAGVPSPFSTAKRNQVARPATSGTTRPTVAPSRSRSQVTRVPSASVAIGFAWSAPACAPVTIGAPIPTASSPVGAAADFTSPAAIAIRAVAVSPSPLRVHDVREQLVVARGKRRQRLREMPGRDLGRVQVRQRIQAR